ncbi:MAG: UDP-N-acetylglucosamine 2-epimerase (hydrolyzing) [Lachnospiraceae bacterium]|nr:UDP-N-acetylglucosamine 2-epimerase (hydrolyzing) [Lachnospiraceae bacterium]
MKSIAILTATRAEYGLLKNVIDKLINKEQIDVRVIVTGAHLSSEFGMTVNEIENDGIPIDKKIEILLSSDSSIAVSKAMGLALISFSEYFEEKKPDALMVLGDRYETLAVCIAAMNTRIPIIHIHGGETTQGAIDEAVRHSITKMSSLHFTSTEEYRRRVIQLGENPRTVFNVGALGVENALNTKLFSKSQFQETFGIDLAPKYAIGTFHPVTLENGSAATQIEEIIKAILQYPDIQFIFTKANADENGRIINERLELAQEKYENILLVDSLGMRGYLSAISNALFVIGNSSSGLIEVPAFQIPTINIGDRQKGRIQGSTIINCAPEEKDICNAIDMATNSNFISKLRVAKNPYGKGSTSDNIVNITIDFLVNKGFEFKKKFYDLKFEVWNE